MRNGAGRDAKKRVSFARWFFASTLLAFSDLAATMATFMPMKSVFILAADSVPGFFPKALVVAGPATAAAALLAVAVGFASLTALTKNLANQTLSQDQTLPEQAKRQIHKGGHRVPRMLTAQELSLVIVAVTLLSGSAIFSLSFTVLIALWICCSALVLYVITHRRLPLPPYISSSSEFHARFKRWMGQSALWATVLAASLVLLLGDPTFGLTAILLDSVLLMRLHKVAGDLAPRFLGAQLGVAEGAYNENAQRTGEIFAPLEYLSTLVGQNLLTKDLERFGYANSDWQFVGRATRTQASLLAKQGRKQQWILIRIFAVDAIAERDSEYSKREVLSGLLLSEAHLEKVSFANLPAIKVKWSGLRNSSLQDVQPAEIIAWQIAFEADCLRDIAVQDMLGQYEVPDPDNFLKPHLQTVAKLKGTHTSSIAKIIKNFRTIRNNQLSGQRVFGFGVNVTPANFLKLESGELEPIDLGKLGVAPIGTYWAETPGYLKAWRESLKRGVMVFSGRQRLEARLRATVMSLSRTLQTRDFSKIDLRANQVLELLNELNNLPPKGSRSKG